MKQKLFLDNLLKELEKEILVGEKKYDNIVVSHYLVDDNNKKKVKRDAGDFFTINYQKEFLLSNPKVIMRELKKVLNSFLKKYNKGKVLIIGLGNSDVLCDSLGVLTANNIIATNHYNDFLTIPKVAIFKPEITEKTGISSYKLISLVVKELNPDTIIIIDSLATKNKSYLNNCLEINDVGIIPGSAIKDNKKINKHTFNIPVISVGIPLVFEDKNKLFTTTDIEEVVKKSANIIATVLNDLLLH